MVLSKTSHHVSRKYFRLIVCSQLICSNFCSGLSHVTRMAGYRFDRAVASNTCVVMFLNRGQCHVYISTLSTAGPALMTPAKIIAGSWVESLLFRKCAQKMCPCRCRQKAELLSNIVAFFSSRIDNRNANRVRLWETLSRLCRAVLSSPMGVS